MNMLEAETYLSRLVEALESGGETEIIIARNGKTRRSAGAVAGAAGRGADRSRHGQVYDARRHLRCERSDLGDVWLSTRIRLLLDTHIALWSVLNDARMPTSV
jgi:hypothetical protein